MNDEQRDHLRDLQIAQETARELQKENERLRAALTAFAGAARYTGISALPDDAPLMLFSQDEGEYKFSEIICDMVYPSPLTVEHLRNAYKALHGKPAPIQRDFASRLFPSSSDDEVTE